MAQKQEINKKLYRWLLLATKLLPMLLAFFHLLNVIFAYFGLNELALNYIAGISLLPLAYLYLASYTFQYCKTYRYYLHYCVGIDIINVYDYYFPIPISNQNFCLGLVGFTIIMLFIILYKNVISQWRN